MRTDILARQNDIERWIQESRSKAFMCRELNCKPETLGSYLDRMGLVYRGNQGGKGHKVGLRRPIKDYLVYGSLIKSHMLKLRLLRDGVKSRECERCEGTEWLEGKIPLELHHRNGDGRDNRLENLQLLCPNCHSLTDNHAGKGKRKRAPMSEQADEPHLECGALVA